MNENKNPFAQSSRELKRANDQRHLLIGAGCLGLILIATFAGLAFWQQSQTHTRLRAQLEELVSQEAGNKNDLAQLKEKLAAAELRVAELEKEKEMSGHIHQGLEEEMRATLESKDVTISQLQGKLTVNILDRILFDSGEAVLQAEGEAVLKKIAGILAQHPQLKIHVIGHTDNVPIRAGARSRFASNWELSTARALAAVRFLTDFAGVDPHRLGAVGYGEFRPLADNVTAEGRAKNRRIAITILPDEWVGVDTLPDLPRKTTIPPPGQFMLGETNR